jgi:cell wall-associated NlpC family hydrolase
MIPFFSTPARLASLESAVSKWVGTPWRPNSRVCGVGASCHHAVAGVLIDAGFNLPEIPDGSSDWARHQKESIQSKWLDSQPNFVRRYGSPFPGDVVGFKLGGCIHHLGIVLTGERFFQCIKSTGAAVLPCSEREFQRHLAGIWTPSI